MAANEKSEEKMVHLLRNALIVAGQEMGANGDHWPVIKSTVHSIMKDWEDLKIERNVYGEMKKFYEHLIHELKNIHRTSTAALKPVIADAITELEDVYKAAFTGVKKSDLHIEQEDIPAYLKRADAILNTLEGANE